MRWRLRQVTAIVGDLAGAVTALRSRLGLEVSRRDDGSTAEQHGLDNVWLPIGSTFLEVGQPTPDSAFDRFHRRHGDGGYMTILQTDDLPAARRSLDAAGVAIAWEIDEPDAKELHLHHADLGGTILAIDWAEDPDEWRWAGARWREHVRTGVIDELLGAGISVPDPTATAHRWGEVLRRTPERVDESTSLIALDRGWLRFEASNLHGRGRLTSIDVAAARSDVIGRRVELAGLRFRFVDPARPALHSHGHGSVQYTQMGDLDDR